MGQSFQVNTYQAGYQTDSHILATPDGGFLIVWGSAPTRTGEGKYGLYGQYYDPNGDPLGAEFQLVEGTGALQDKPAITGLEGGGHVLTWRTDAGLWARISDAGGTPSTDPFLVASSADYSNIFGSIGLTATNDGGFTIAFTNLEGSFGGSPYLASTHAQVYSADGTAKGPVVALNAVDPDFLNSEISAATLKNTTVIVWQSEEDPYGLGVPNVSIRATILFGHGSIVNKDFVLASNLSEYSRQPDIAALNDGNFVVAYQGKRGIVLSFHSGDGSLLGEADGFSSGVVIPNGTGGLSNWYFDFGDIRVTQLPSGEIVLAFSTYQISEYSDDEVIAQVFSATGEPLGDFFQIHTDYPFIQNAQNNIEVQALEGGGFVVAYDDRYSYATRPTDDYGIMAHIYGRGTNGNDTLTVDESGMLYGLSGDDMLTGDAASNRLDGGAGNDTLVGGLGNDTLQGSAGDDQLTGGAGIDTVAFTTTAAIRVNLALETAQNTGEGLDQISGIEHVISAGGDDMLEGNDLANSLSGNAGNDTLIGGLGDDTLHGGAGDDQLTGGDGIDTITFTTRAAIRVNLTLETAQNTGEGRDQISGIEHVISAGGNDALAGNDLANSLSGNAGNDSLIGYFGNDTLQGGAGNDELTGGGGIDTIVFTTNAAVRVDLRLETEQNTGEGLDQIRGFEQVISGAGDDILIGNDLENRLTGNAGNDWLEGGRDNDALLGGQGRDSLDGGGGHDILNGGQGEDTAIYAGDIAVDVSLAISGLQTTGIGSDKLLEIENLIGGNGFDRLIGDAGRNILDGGIGNDALFGGSGNDVLLGGAGSDRLVGGAGADTFLFTRFSPLDRVFDFEDGTDKLRIDVVNPAAPGITITAGSGGTLLDWGTGSILLDNINPDQINGFDLIFV